MEYSFKVNGEITKCSECPLFDFSWKACTVYALGIPSRHGYKNYDTEKPDWCELKTIINNKIEEPK